MSRFTKATYELLPNGRARLTSDLVYEVGHLGSGWKIIVLKNFETDFVSPRWLSKILSKSKPGRKILESLTRAAIVHDSLRVDIRVPKLLGDYIFFEAAGVDKTPTLIRYIAFLLVLLNFSRY